MSGSQEKSAENMDSIKAYGFFYHVVNYPIFVVNSVPLRNWLIYISYIYCNLNF
jgi:hypothetical protein